MTAVLRPPQDRDLPAIAALRADTGLQHQLMAHPGPAAADPLAEARDWIARRAAAGFFRIVAETEAEGAAAGFLQIADIHRRNRTGCLGIALLPAARGRGLGALALALGEAAARDALGLRKLVLMVRADNRRAAALYDRAGWRPAGRLVAHYDDGAREHDVLLYEKRLQGRAAA